METIVSSLFAALSAYHLLLVVLGLAGGTILGALPGLSAVMGITLMMPFTLTMPPESGLILLGSIFVGAMYGGANSAILLNIPGTPSSLATTFDGYPLTKQGHAKRALWGAVWASMVGGVIGGVALLLFFEPLARLGFYVGAPEYMWLAILGLTVIVSISEGSLGKGIIGAGIGLFLGTVGISQFTGTPRFTFDQQNLMLGVDLVPALVGLFAIPEMIRMVSSRGARVGHLHNESGAVRWVLQQMNRAKLLLLRSSILGIGVGMMPGAGGSVASLIAYNESKRWDIRSDRYGRGEIRGLFSSEAANNAQAPGTMIPTLALGIPGSAVAAVMMGGLLAHGIWPGPQLLETSGDIAYTFIIALIIANVLLLPVGGLLLNATSKVLATPVRYLVPFLLVLTVVGSLAPRGQAFDVVVMFFIGIIAFLLNKCGVGSGAIALGLVLSPIIESNLVVSMSISATHESLMSVLLFRPVAGVLAIICLLSLLSPSAVRWLKRRKNRREVFANDSA